MQPLGIVVAGAGQIGRRHIELIRASSECRLLAIVDPSAAAPDLADRLAVPCYHDLAQLFARERPAGVILATPNALHVQQTLACIEAGVAALVEKPVAHTLEQAEHLLAEVERSGARVLVGHHRAHSPILAAARALITNGGLGELVAVQGSALFYKPQDYFDSAPWRREAGGGPILINLIHEIGNLRSLCGEIVAVQALASSAVRGHAVEDTVAINLRFAGGALGTFLLSDTAASARSWEQTSQENPDYTTYTDEDCYTLAGTQGSLAVPSLRFKRYADTGARSWFEPFDCSTLHAQRDDPLQHQLSHFCALIRGEVEPLVSVRDGVQNVRIIDAIARAVSSGGTVEIS